MTPLCTASYDHRVPVIRGLINSGADVNAVDDWGNTPLMCAVSTLSTDTWPLLYIDREGRYPCYPWRMTVIQLLIGCGANVGTQNALDINARNSCGQTAFYAVGLKIPRLACAGDGEVVQQLLQNGADTEAKDSHRRTTLHMSALNGKLDVVELLLTYKAEIEAVDEEGRTPLWVAAWSGTAGVVQLLLDHGANSEAMDTHSRTPLQVAVMKSHDDVDWILSWRGSSDAACVGLQRLFSEADDASAYPHQSLNP
ncbi:hypothetical protein LMH87_001710 [Akanthomyces muscarius]|uniref:Ankyrin repeat protein n=1 Tax=Akanthomyces muscarius TaxID=2231603 RepID=A0A9W8Q857_AKAMU|nr:hypothetical protein LMH87_001710 [Akanthomyces muscarius]KAJ4147166.1 hypothetical protein LMH87_001710 [Akanthomyces muscarius]